MANYIQIEIQTVSTEQKELLIAELSMIGFEGFEEEEKLLKAFIPEDDFDENIIDEIAAKNNVTYNQAIIEETNWNALWESNFEPISVNDFVGIRAHFHEPIRGVKHEIVITPKMSFGTGHHATTFMMIQQMKELDFVNKTVFDFGTGTGILAILAEKSGAEKILAIDNDDWSIENTKENLERNNCLKVELQKADDANMKGEFDIILANINKNVILENFLLLTQQLKKGGVLLLSGLLAEDETEILSAAGKFSLFMGKITKNNNWISLRFSR